MDKKSLFLGSFLTFFCFNATLFAMQDDLFYDKTDLKKGAFEKRLYYGLEKIDNLTPQQKEKINQALKEFQVKKEKISALNVKKFQLDDVDSSAMKQIIYGSADSPMTAKVVVLDAVHRALTPKQREQFMKKFLGMIE